MPTGQQHDGRIEGRLLDARSQFLGYIRTRIDDPEPAEDILQDGLLRAIRAAPDLRDEQRLIPWFYCVPQNVVVDAYRRRGVKQALRRKLEETCRACADHGCLDCTCGCD